jgi:phosphatidylserine/phosphatidylglycerophosphate/cardiolipin synthase-like enzyme
MFPRLSSRSRRRFALQLSEMRERKVRTAAGPIVKIAIAVAVLGLSRPLAAGAAEVYFSPNGGCTTAVVREIGAARQSIEVQAYSFTSPPIAQALAEAKERGVHVEVILDKSNRTARYSGADYLVHHGIPTRIDAAHAIAHNKVMIIDDAVVLTGSFNFTAAAEKHNAENLLVLRDPSLAKQYLRNWKLHAVHSPLYRAEGYTTAQRALEGK